MKAAVLSPPVRQGACGLWLAVGLALVGLALVLLGTGVGSMGLENLWPALMNAQADPAAHAMALQIVWDIRLPRSVGAFAAGALLGLAGALAMAAAMGFAAWQILRMGAGIISQQQNFMRDLGL